MSRKEELMLEKEQIDDEIGFLFYTDDIKDGLMRIRQALDEISKTGHIQNTSDPYIDTYMWSEQKYKRLVRVLKDAEKVYAELLAFCNEGGAFV